MNVVGLIGRLTDHPELKHTADSTAVCTFSLAVQRPRSKDKTDFINCVAWRSNAEFICKYFHKGQRIGIVGSLTVDRYEDSEGNKRTKYEVKVDTADFCESRSEETSDSERVSTYTPKPDVIIPPAEPYVSSVPFPVDEFEDISPMDGEDFPF